MKKKKRNIKILIFSIIIVYFVGFLGSIFTSDNTNSDWYKSIKPSITPPNFVFPIVWNVLFFLIGMSLYFAWTESKKKDKGNIILFYGLNFVLNVL
nr:TspO protein [Nanoarchaeum sp.]